MDAGTTGLQRSHSQDEDREIESTMEEESKSVFVQASSLDKGYLQKWTRSGENYDDESSDVSSENEEYDDLPAFADFECRQLHQLTLEINLKCEKKSRRTKQMSDRLKAMREHMQHIRQEIDLTNGLIAASKDDVRAEEHLVALGEREKAKILDEINDIDKAISAECGILKNIHAQKDKASEETERLKLALNCNQEELEQWAKSAALKEADYLNLEKYTRIDDVRIKDLTMKLETMNVKYLEKQAELENEAMDTQTLRLELDRCLEMFHKEQKERQSMISQWQETVEFMKKRDTEIEEVSKKYSDLAVDLDTKLRKIIQMRQDVEARKVSVMVGTFCLLGILSKSWTYIMS